LKKNVTYPENMVCTYRRIKRDRNTWNSTGLYI